MIMTEQLQPSGANRVNFRRLSMEPTHAGASTLRQTVYQPLPQIDVERIAKIAGKSLPIPNWMVAVSCAAALGLSVALSAGIVNSPATAASSYVQSGVGGESARLVWSGSMALAQTSSPVDESKTSQIATLQGQVHSMSSDLQQLQQDNDALRNLNQQQSSDLTSARSNLAASQDALSGQSQDMDARLSDIQQNLDGKVSDLQGAVSSADDTINAIRKLLGMPAISMSSGN